MAFKFKFFKSCSRKAILLGVSVFVLSGCGSSQQSLTIVETFENNSQCDYTNTTGFWNVYHQRAQAVVVANSDPLKPLSFGNGSDGIVSSTSGYTFDTDLKPNGYNFNSLSITGGTITVQGSNPLIIRALKSITISPSIDLDGTAGTDGSQTTNATATGGNGGTTKAGAGTGGAGGNVNSVVGLMTGGNGKNGLGVTQAGSGGAGSNVAGGAATNGSTSGAPGGNLDLAAQFVPGGGGGGGGGHFNVGDTTYATGGAGGGGGGLIRILAPGPVSVGTITARGGNGGRTQSTITSNGCSGNGSGGNGGAVWLQSFSSLTALTTPNTLAGVSGASLAPCFSPGSTTDGYSRADAPSLPSWVGSGGNVGFNTRYSASGSSHIVQSKAYDLQTANAGFYLNPEITQTLNNGSITVDYAGSTDDVTYSGFTTNIFSLSNQNYRYLKFRVSITTEVSATSLSPYVSRISIPYKELSTLSGSDLTLAAGCASLVKVGNNSTSKLSKSELKTHLPTLFLFLMIVSSWLFYRRVTVENRGDKNALPASSVPPT